MDETKKKIFSELMKESSPLVFSPPWDFLNEEYADRRVIPDTAKTLKFLKKKFGDAQLLSSGLFEPHSLEGCRIKSELCNVVSGFMPISGRRRNMRVYDTKWYPPNKVEFPATNESCGEGMGEVFDDIY